MATKTEWKAQLEAAGIALPDNWAKMTSARAENFAKTALQKSPTKRILNGMATATMAAASAVAGLGSAAVEAGKAFVGLADAVDALPGSVRRPQAKAATMPKNPNWGRTERKYSKYSFYPTHPAPDPEPMTRQVRRQNERRAGRMPIGARQSAWHALNNFGRDHAGRAG